MRHRRTSCPRAVRTLEDWLGQGPGGAGCPATADLAALGDHLHACPACADRVAEQVALQAVLHRLAEQLAPPAEALGRARRVAAVLGRTGRRPLDDRPLPPRE